MSDAPVAGGDNQESGSAAPDNAQSVSYETHRKLLSEKKRRDEELAEARNKLNQLESERKAKEESELRQKEDWKKMLEIREQELAQVRSQQTQYSQQIEQFVKKTAFVKAIGGNFNPAYERLIDFDQIPIDPTTNGIDEMGLTKYVDTFKKTFKEVITPLPGPTPSFAAPQGAPSQGESESDKMKRLAKFF